MSPVSIAVDHAGQWLVADQQRVQAFTAKGVFVTQFAESSLEVRYPVCVCVDLNGRILVAGARYRVHVFAF